MRPLPIAAVFFAAFACASGDRASESTATATPARRYEFFTRTITAIDDLGDGVVAVAFDPMARSFVIHPELSPDHAALVAFARAAHADGRAVHATVWLRGKVEKTAPPWPVGQWLFVIVRLADEPDPRAGKSAR